MSPSRHVPTPSRTSRPFVTDATGRFTVTPDWQAVLRALGALDCVALQTRHTYARLIHCDRLPHLAWDEAGERALAPAGVLSLRTQHWHSANGRIDLCPCCGTTGRIEFVNPFGGDFLQVCPGLEVRPHEWAHLLTPFAERAWRAPEAPAPHAGQIAFPLLPANVAWTPVSQASLRELFGALPSLEIPLRFTLRTPEATHSRIFRPSSCEMDSPLLTLGDGETTLQVAPPGVRGLSLDASTATLSLVGSDRTVLLTVAPADEASPEWLNVLHARHPSLLSP